MQVRGIAVAVAALVEGGHPAGVGGTAEQRKQLTDAVKGARVDIWHCDAGGHYSNYPGPGEVRERPVSAQRETFLRGTQMADGRIFGHIQNWTVWPPTGGFYSTSYSMYHVLSVAGLYHYTADLVTTMRYELGRSGQDVEIRIEGAGALKNTVVRL